MIMPIAVSEQLGARPWHKKEHARRPASAALATVASFRRQQQQQACSAMMERHAAAAPAMMMTMIDARLQHTRRHERLVEGCSSGFLE